MSEPRPLTRSERTASTLMKLGMWLMEGYALPFTDDVVRSFGVRGAVLELFRYNRVKDALAARYGERDAHLLLGFAALWNGCGYCSVGHVFASNLLRFREQGLLFPIDQDETERLQHMPDEQAMERVRELLRGDSRYARVLGLLERQLKLKRPPASPGAPSRSRSPTPRSARPSASRSAASRRCSSCWPTWPRTSTPGGS